MFHLCARVMGCTVTFRMKTMQIPHMMPSELPGRSEESPRQKQELKFWSFVDYYIWHDWCDTVPIPCRVQSCWQHCEKQYNQLAFMECNPWKNCVSPMFAPGRWKTTKYLLPGGGPEWLDGGKENSFFVLSWQRGFHLRSKNITQKICKDAYLD